MDTSSNNPNDTSLRKVLLIAVIALLILVIGGHLILPLLGIAIAATVITAGAWSAIIIAVLLFAFFSLLVFIVPGVIVLLLCVLAFVGMIIAIALFPLLFPILIPLFIILLVISFVRKRKGRP